MSTPSSQASSISVASSTRYAVLRAGLERDLDQADRVGGVAGADHDHQVGVRGDLLDRELAVLGGVADVVAGRVEQLREPLADRGDRLQRLVDRQRGLREPGDLRRVADHDVRRRRRGSARAGCARAPRRRCPRPPRGPRGRSAGCRSPRRRTASPRGAPWSPAGRWRRSSSGCARSACAVHLRRDAVGGEHHGLRPRAPRRAPRRRSRRATRGRPRRACCARSACGRRPGAPYRSSAFSTVITARSTPAQ